MMKGYNVVGYTIILAYALALAAAGFAHKVANAAELPS